MSYTLTKCLQSSFCDVDELLSTKLITGKISSMSIATIVIYKHVKRLDLAVD